MIHTHKISMVITPPAHVPRVNHCFFDADAIIVHAYCLHSSSDQNLMVIDFLNEMSTDSCSPHWKHQNNVYQVIHFRKYHEPKRIVTLTATAEKEVEFCFRQ